jgi:energy-coupling factor transporter ATP-binding protein EcfA2
MMQSTRRFLKIWGRHYKAFEEAFSLELAPVTVVFGRNGSGKSALVRLPALLEEALRNLPNDPPGLPSRARGLEFGNSLASFCHGRLADRYELGFELDDGTGLAVVVGKAAGSRVSLPAQWIEQWRLAAGGERLDIDWDRTSKAYPIVGSSSPVFSRLVPLVAGSIPPGASRLWPIPQVAHLQATRSLAGEDFAAGRPEVLLDVGPHGEKTRQVLSALHLNQRQEALGHIIDQVKRCMGIELRVEEAQGAVTGSVTQARPVAREAWSPLGELGTGFAHALPVIVQFGLVATAQPGDPVPGLIACEEPEAHLHPRAQADVADVIVDAALTGRTTCLVETHSETVVLRIRRRIAEGRIKPWQVAFYWVDDEAPVTEVRRLEVQENSRLDGWPEGWFDAALDEVSAIHRAVRG